MCGLARTREVDLSLRNVRHSRPAERAATQDSHPVGGDVPVAEQVEFRKLTRAELDELAGEALPERAAMSLINANVAAPVNLAAALNVLSDNSIAIANAQQTAPITQTT